MYEDDRQSFLFGVTTLLIDMACSDVCTCNYAASFLKMVNYDDSLFWATIMNSAS